MMPPVNPCPVQPGLRRLIVPLALLLALAVPCCSVGSARAGGPTPAASGSVLVAQGPGAAQGGGMAVRPPAPGTAKKSGSSIDWLQILMYVGGGIVGVIVLALIVKAVKDRQHMGPVTTAAADVIGGYRLQKLMNTGQTSQVWEVVETSSNRHFAMKFLLPEKIHDQEYRQLLFHEAEVGIQLAHPNVIKIVKLDKNLHNPYFVMEYFPGGSLHIRIMRKQWDFLKPRAHDILKQTATALAYMNANGWVHRDVKPDNIMVNSAGEVRLIDFALAVRVSKGGMFKRKKVNQPAGTKSYMSPEQIRGEWLDGRADIYSFGASCFELVTGRLPLVAGSPQDLLRKQIVEKPSSPQYYNTDVTDKFADLVLRMLSKRREDRPKDFHEVMMEMRTLQVFKSVVSTSTQPS